MFGGNAERLERLRHSWSDRARRVDRLVTWSRLAIPLGVVLLLLPLSLLWADPFLRLALILVLVLFAQAFVYLFFWYLARWQALLHRPFQGVIAAVRSSTPHSHSRVMFIGYWGLFVGEQALWLWALAVLLIGPRTAESVLGSVYPLAAAGLFLQAGANAISLPFYRKVDRTVLGTSFSSRLAVSILVSILAAATLMSFSWWRLLTP